jgi:hypothetical protein
MQQDGGSTSVCLIFLLLMIKNDWIGQVKFGVEVNYNNFTQNMQNNFSLNYLNMRQY